MVAYDDVLRLRVLPELGTVRLQALTPLHIVRWQTARVQAGVWPQRVRVGHKVLSTALATGVRWGLLPSNPAESVGRPRKPRRERTVWTEEETARLVASLGGYTGLWDPLWLFLLGSGCRRGEALGLQWGDLDWERGTVSICRAVQVVRNRAQLGSPKTSAATRTLTLPPFALDALRVQRQRQAARRLAAGPGWPGGDYIFTTASGQHPLAWNLLKALRSACARADVPLVTLHGLRHAHASLVNRAGVDPKALQKRLGHTSL